MPETGATSKEQQRHLDLVERLDDIVRAILASAAGGTLPPIVNVSVDPPTVTLSPSEVVVQDRLYELPRYLFTVNRDHIGFIVSILAEPIDD